MVHRDTPKRFKTDENYLNKLREVRSDLHSTLDKVSSTIMKISGNTGKPVKPNEGKPSDDLNRPWTQQDALDNVHDDFMRKLRSKK